MARPPKVVKNPVIYRHTAHAEWGLGTIVEETPSKIAVAFEDGVRRSFANAVRFRALLVPVELEPAAAAETLAKIAKNAPKPVTAKAAKGSGKSKAKPAEDEESEGEPAEEDEEEGEEIDEDDDGES